MGGRDIVEVPKILLVEDEVLIQEILLAEFEESGFEIVTANSGNDAIAQLKTEAGRFKAVITDINLLRDRMAGRSRDMPVNTFPTCRLSTSLATAPTSGHRRASRTALCF
jgi:CheY-like chemotaxis protein